MNTQQIAQRIAQSIAVKQRILEDDALLERIGQAGVLMCDAIRLDKKILFCGNGGSAADAQHLAAEMSGRFYRDRRALPAEALHVNPSFVTAVANDYGFDQVYARMVQAIGRKDDLLVAISTSGNSPNILHAIKAAKEQGMMVIGMTGQSGGQMAGQCDILLNVPDSDTPRIQESHILIGHILCEMVEHSI